MNYCIIPILSFVTGKNRGERLSRRSPLFLVSNQLSVMKAVLFCLRYYYFIYLFLSQLSVTSALQCSRTLSLPQLPGCRSNNCISPVEVVEEEGRGVVPDGSR